MSDILANLSISLDNPPKILEATSLLDDLSLEKLMWHRFYFSTPELLRIGFQSLVEVGQSYSKDKISQFHDKDKFMKMLNHI